VLQLFNRLRIGITPMALKRAYLDAGKDFRITSTKSIPQITELLTE
jgi:hypothetical protein